MPRKNLGAVVGWVLIAAGALTMVSALVALTIAVAEVTR